MNTESLVPMLFTTMKNYSKEQFFKDLISGIIVAIIALPLSIALALASGVGPERGIYTAIVAGFLISFFGGSRVQIAGPTAAFATIVAGIVVNKGMSALITATIMAGIILIIMGLLKFGTLIKFIPYTITTGFTAGIAVTIVVGQLKDFFGLTFPKGTVAISTIDKLSAVINSFRTVNGQAIIVGLVCLAILIVWPYINKTIPGSLIAVLIGIAMVKGIGMQVNTIGDLYEIKSSLPALTLPDFSLSTIRDLIPDAFTIAILAAIESLLSCVVADGMTGGRHRSNMELVAQGIGNIGSALFGGIPATGAIARTAANIKNGAKTPIAGIVHSIVLLLTLVVLMPYAALIPMPTIAAILFMVAYNMCQWRPFLSLCRRAPKSDITVLVLTFVLTVVFDLVVAIEFGMLVAVVLFMKRMSDETKIKGWKDDDINPDTDADSIQIRKVPKAVDVYEISGPMFFGVTNILSDISAGDKTKCIIIRMRSVPALDATALRALREMVERGHKKGITVIFSHVNEQPMRSMKKSGLYDLIGEDNFCVNIDAALERANAVIFI